MPIFMAMATISRPTDAWDASNSAKTLAEGQRLSSPTSAQRASVEPDPMIQPIPQCPESMLLQRLVSRSRLAARRE
jgi:hypothetical protein